MEAIKNKFGLNGTQIKLILIVLMVLDHIHQMFYNTQFAPPIWFTYLGRLVAPMFIFLAAEGMFYTKDRKKHLSRLYIASALMASGNILIQNIFSNDGVVLINGMFTTIFLGCWYIYFIDGIINGVKSKNKKLIFIGTVGLLIPLLTSAIVLYILFSGARTIGFTILSCMLPTLILAEGGIPFIALLVLLYYLRKHRTLQMLVIILLGAFTFIVTGQAITVANLLNNFTWILMFSVIFIALYNDKKGKGMKNFFYYFYPLHIYALYILAWFLTVGK